MFHHGWFKCVNIAEVAVDAAEEAVVVEEATTLVVVMSAMKAVVIGIEEEEAVVVAAAATAVGMEGAEVVMRAAMAVVDIFRVEPGEEYFC